MPKNLLDAFQSVMATVASFGFDTDRAEREVQVVGNDKHILERDVLLVDPIFQCLATKVHISVGLEQKEGAPLKFILGHGAISCGLERKRFLFSQKIKDAKTDIVP